MFRLNYIVDEVRFDDGEISRQLANIFQGQQRVSQMIDHAEKEDDVKRPQFLFRQLVNAHLVKLGLRIQRLARFEIIFRTPTINRSDLSAVAFGLETVKSVPAADVQQRLAAQVIGQP